jgi:hypothetical protein
MPSASMRQTPEADRTKRGLWLARVGAHSSFSDGFLRKPSSAAKTKEGHAIAKTTSGRKSNHVCQLSMTSSGIGDSNGKYAALRQNGAYFPGFGIKEA